MLPFSLLSAAPISVVSLPPPPRQLPSPYAVALPAAAAVQLAERVRVPRPA
jgi:hypothetical protein